MLALRLFVVVVAVAFAGPAFAEVTGVAPSGKKGTLHRVVEGDTLWDLTARYIGTPWIWPSIWKENDAIENPHLIYPGDLIWITDREMRKVTPEEAEALLAEPPAAPAAPGMPPALTEAPKGPVDFFAVLDSQSALQGPSVFHAGLHRSGFVSGEEMEAAAAVLGTHREHYWMSETQQMIVSAGEGRTDVGKEYTVFRVRRRVMHPETGELLGYFIDVVGRAEITEVYPETSYAVVKAAYSEIEPGDRLVPYEQPPEEFTASAEAKPVSGIILAQQPHRVYSGRGDLVVLDRGLDDGVEPGRELLVFRPGGEAPDPLTSMHLLEPDHRVGRAFVLKAEARTALALVTEAKTEVRQGDHFRSF
jgi:hypothetical protein